MPFTFLIRSLLLFWLLLLAQRLQSCPKAFNCAILVSFQGPRHGLGSSCPASSGFQHWQQPSLLPLPCNDPNLWAEIATFRAKASVLLRLVASMLVATGKQGRMSSRFDGDTKKMTMPYIETEIITRKQIIADSLRLATWHIFLFHGVKVSWFWCICVYRLRSHFL